jgi:hypothetical protein
MLDRLVNDEGFTMSYEIGDRVIVNMRNLNPDLIPPASSSEVRGTVIENPSPGLYHVRLDDSIEGCDILIDLGEDRLMPYPPPFDL